MLERLAASPHRPALVVTRPDRPRGRGRRLVAAARGGDRARARDRASTSPTSSTTSAARAADRRRRARGGLRLRVRRADQGAAALRAPDAQRAPVAAAALARRGADRAGDHGRRRARPASRSCALTAGLDSGPVCLQQPEPIRPDDTYGTLAARLQALGGELLVRALDEHPDVRRAGRAPWPPTRRRSPPSDRLDPRSRRRAGARRARADPAHRRAPRARETARSWACARLALRRRARPHHRPEPSRSTAGCRCSGCADGALELRDRAAARPPGDGRRGLPARPPRRRGSLMPTTARRTRFSGARLRVHRAPPRVRGGRLRRPGARGRGHARSSRRDRALAMPLAYGAVQRRRHARPRRRTLLSRPLGRLDPPVLAALRLGLYQLLFLDGVADHAAVRRDRRAGQAARPARGRPRQRGAAPGYARGPGDPRRRFDDATPTRAALLHSVPPGSPSCGGTSSGRRTARALLAATTSPPRPRCGSTRSSPRSTSWHAQLGVPYAAAPGIPEGLVARGAVRRPGLRGLSATARHARSRAPRCWSRRVLDAARRRARARPVRRAGRQDHAPRRADGGRGRGRRGRAPPGRAEALRSDLPRGCSAGVRQRRRRPTRPRSTTPRGLRPRARRPAVLGLGTLQSRPDLRWRATPEAIDELAELQRRILAAAAPRRARRHAGLLDLHDLAAGERGRCRALPARAPGLRRRRPAEQLPALAPCRGGPRALQLLPRPRRHRRVLHRPAAHASRTAVTLRATVTEPSRQARSVVPRLRRAVAAPDQPARPLPLRVLPAALRARLGVPELRRALDDRADVEHRDRHVQPLRAACCRPSEPP